MIFLIHNFRNLHSLAQVPQTLMIPSSCLKISIQGQQVTAKPNTIMACKNMCTIHCIPYTSILNIEINTRKSIFILVKVKLVHFNKALQCILCPVKSFSLHFSFKKKMFARFKSHSRWSSLDVEGSYEGLGQEWGLGSVFQNKFSLFIPVLRLSQSIHHSAIDCGSVQRLSFTVTNKPINLTCHKPKANWKTWGWIFHQSKSA